MQFGQIRGKIWKLFSKIFKSYQSTFEDRLLKGNYGLHRDKLIDNQSDYACFGLYDFRPVLARCNFSPVSSVTRLGDLLDFGQLFKAFGYYKYARISPIVRQFL